MYNDHGWDGWGRWRYEISGGETGSISARVVIACITILATAVALLAAYLS